MEVKKEISLKEESRKIVKVIIDHGVTESQKIDIMYFLALTLENHKTLQEVTEILKKFKTYINKNEEISKIKSKPNKILT